MKYYKINTYGCQMNVHESEKLAGMIEEFGYQLTDSDTEADLIVFNTCCIRENAERTVYGNVGALKPIKKKKKDLIIAVGGCMTQQNSAGEDLLSKFPYVSYRIGPFEIENVIMELPYILECGVCAAPDEIRGQVVKASIVLVNGMKGTDELKKEIQNYVKSRTAPYKYPRIIEFRDSLPKTTSGKIIRKQL